jgi:hypothetical protein
MRIGGPFLWIWLLASLCAVSLSGCAQVIIVTDEQQPKSELRFGVLSVDVSASNKNTIVSTSGFGLISNPSGSALGYSSGRIVRLGDDCRLVLQLQNPEDVARQEELVRLLKSIPHACGA